MNQKKFEIILDDELIQILNSNGYIVDVDVYDKQPPYTAHIYLEHPPDFFPTSLGRTWGEVKDNKTFYDTALPLAFSNLGNIRMVNSDKPKVAEHHPRLEMLLQEYKSK